MKAVISALLVFAAFASFLPPLAAAESARGTPMASGMMVDSMRASAKIVGMDQAKHTITLQMPDGRTRTFKVQREAAMRNLKVGDVISATIIDSLAVGVEKGGPKPGATETQTVMLSPKGAPQRTVIANTIRATGKVQKVDARTRMVSIMGPNHQIRTFKVGPNVDLSRLKAGDDVTVRYTEALVISLTKPTK